MTEDPNSLELDDLSREENKEQVEESSSDAEEDLWIHSAASEADAEEVSGQLENTNLALDTQLATEAVVANAEMSNGSNDDPIGPPTPALQQAQDNRAEVLNDIATQTENNEKAKKGLFITRFKFQSFAIGMAVTVVGTSIAIWAAILAKKSGKTPDDTLSDQQKAVIWDQVNAWNALPDTEFWASMAKYVDTYKPSLQAQILFMTYTKMLADVPAGWGWTNDSKDAVLAVVEQAYYNNSLVSDYYRTVATQTAIPIGATVALPVPRNPAADVCSLALSNLYVLFKNQQKPAIGPPRERPLQGRLTLAEDWDDEPVDGADSTPPEATRAQHT